MQGMRVQPRAGRGISEPCAYPMSIVKENNSNETLGRAKKRSSKWIKTKGAAYLNFYWQDGYGIFSVNPSEIDKVVDYIKNQEEHHQKRDFQDEFRAFLKKYKVEYDERYVWD